MMSVTKITEPLKELITRLTGEHQKSNNLYGEEPSFYIADFNPANKFTAHFNMLHVDYVSAEELSTAELLLRRFSPEK